MLITGSPPEECSHSIGDFMLVKSLKNKLDYSKQKKFKVFHNMATFDARMGGSWGKLPLLRTFMVTYPEVEWFWWIEADSIITGKLKQTTSNRSTYTTTPSTPAAYSIPPLMCLRQTLPTSSHSYRGLTPLCRFQIQHPIQQV